MSLEEQIIKEIRELPESKKAEVLDFVEYLKTVKAQGISSAPGPRQIPTSPALT